jgi:predicted ester cyclase
MSDEPVPLEPVELIRSAVAALNGGDVDGYLGHFDPGCRRWIVGSGEPLSLGQVGEGLRQLLAAFGPLHLEADTLFGDGRLVCARWRLRGTHVAAFMGVAATRCEIEVEQCEVYKVDGGGVVESWVYIDPGELFRQIGTQRSGGPVR